MKIFTKMLILAMLLVALYSQSYQVSQDHNAAMAPVGNVVSATHSASSSGSESQAQEVSYYTNEDGSFLYIDGSGQQGSNSLGDRSQNDANLFAQDTSATVVVTGPAPVTIDCPYNQVYDNILCKCVCIIGFHFEGSDCVPNAVIPAVCGKNQIYKDSRCVCAEGFYLIGKVCDVCPPYASYNLAALSCECIPGYVLVKGSCVVRYVPPAPAPAPKVPTCGLNERLVGQNCICIDGFYLIKGACTYCAAPNYYDPQLAICRPKCRTNEVLDFNTLKCVCQGGFFNINGICGNCQPYAVYSSTSKSCECIQGYVLNDGNCIPATRAPVPTRPLPVPSNPCGPNMYFVNQECICQKGFYLISGTCQKCANGTYFDATLRVCRIACQASEIYNRVTKACDCAKDFYRIKGICSSCPGNTTYDAKTQTCGCPSGYRNQGGFCVIGCGVNEIFSNGQCCCITGFYPVNGICGQCEWNEVYDQGLGICRIPCDARRIFDISSQSCVCLPQYFDLADGTCGICPLQSTYDAVTKKCVCNDGFIENLGLCTPACNPYEKFVDGKCICKDGYYLIGYSCGVCPPTLSYDSIYRICRSACKTNEVWDATIRSCRCLPGYYLVGGICSQCDAKTQVYNQKLQCCDCIDGYQKVSGQGCNGVCRPICSENQDWVSGRCVCKPGFFLLNNFCTTCPTGQIYDIYERVCRVQCGSNQVYNFNSGKCDCAQGFYIVQGACSKCLAGESYDEYTQTCSIVPCKGPNEFYSPVTGQCICKPEYVRIRGVCNNCPPGYYYDSYSDQCLCKPGFRLVGGFCQPICPTDQTYVNGECQCNNGLPLTNGKCMSPRPCPLNSYLDDHSECCLCNPGFSVIDGECSNYLYCGQNGYLRYGQCYCKEGYFWILGACRPCGSNEAFNGVVCECLVGYVRNVNGVCVKSNFNPNCYDNERYDSQLKACVCVQGTTFLRGQCQAIPSCPTNAYFDGVQCVCDSGFLLSGSSCISVEVELPSCPDNAYFNGVSCTCNIGFFQSSISACAPCQDGTQWNGVDCVAPSGEDSCASGYQFNHVSNNCQPLASSCGDNASWNGATCVCSDGFHLINNKCQACPANTVFDGSQCSAPKSSVPAVTCGSNEIYVNNACECSNGFFKINGECLSCPENTEWNGKFCVCSNSDASKWCYGKPYTTYTNGSCPCQSSYTNVNGLCTAA